MIFDMRSSIGVIQHFEHRQITVPSHEHSFIVSMHSFNVFFLAFSIAIR